MDWIDSLAELWDRRRWLCLGVGAVVLGSWVVAHRWLPDGFGEEVFRATHHVMPVGPVKWNARLRFAAKNKDLYLGAVPDDADKGDLYGPKTDYHTRFQDGQASLWFRTFGSHEGIVHAGNSPILSIAGPVNNQMATGAEDGSIIVWQVVEDRSSVENIKPLTTLHTDTPVTALTISDDGKLLASGGRDGFIRLWNFSGKPSLLRKIQDVQQTAYKLAFSDDKSMVTNTRADVSPDLPIFSSVSFGDFRGGISSNPPHLISSPDRRFVAITTDSKNGAYLSVWEPSQLIPTGLRYRGYVPRGYSGSVEWSQDSTALGFHAPEKNGSRLWLDALTGTPRTTPAIPERQPVFTHPTPNVRSRIEANRSLVDQLLGRTYVANEYEDRLAIIQVGYVRGTFPLVPFEQLLFPLSAALLAFLIRRSLYWGRKKALAPATAILKAFFSATGAESSEARLGLIQVSRLDLPLSPYSPIPASIAIGPADETHIETLVEKMKIFHGANNRAAGLLFYQEPPNAIALLRMAEARLNQLAVIPIPLAAVEKVKDSPTAARALLNEYAERYLPGRNLFDDLNAISDAVAFFGRGSLLAKLEQELGNHQSLGLWGLRKAGKTSILLQLEQMFRSRPVVRIGLEPYTAQAPFGNKIFNEIQRQLGASIVRLGKPANFTEFPPNAPARDSVTQFLATVQDFAARLGDAHSPLPIICMLDEMERVLPKDAKSAEEFNVTFGALRNLCQDKRVVSLLVTDLFADSSQINQWPIEGAGTNPLFNFLKSVYVGPFEENETVQMLDSLGKLMNFSLDRPQLATIHELSGGHAFLARQIAAMLYDKREDGTGSDRMLANPIRYSGTLRSYSQENVWSPLEVRGDAAALDILSMLAERNDWMTEADLQARCSQPRTVFWTAIEWLANTGVISRRTHEGAGESYRIRMGMFTQWFQQSEISTRKNAQQAL